MPQGTSTGPADHPASKVYHMSTLYTLAYLVNSALALAAGCDSVSIQYHSTRKASDKHDGNARDAGARAFCNALTSTPDGRNLLTLASEGEAGALAALFHGLDMFKRPADAWEAQARWRTGQINPVNGKAYTRPDAQPDYIFHASASLARWNKAQEASKAKPETPPAPVAMEGDASPALPRPPVKASKGKRPSKGKASK